MKKFLRKTRLGILVLLGVFALGFGATQASAQQILNPTGVYKDSNLNWVSTNDGMTALSQEITVIDDQLKVVPDAALKYKRKFFNCILTSLEQGEPVPAALDISFVRFVPGFADSPVEFPNTLTLAVWGGYYEEAANMLLN